MNRETALGFSVRLYGVSDIAQTSLMRQHREQLPANGSYYREIQRADELIWTLRIGTNGAVFATS